MPALPSATRRHWPRLHSPRPRRREVASGRPSPPAATRRRRPPEAYRPARKPGGPSADIARRSRHPRPPSAGASRGPRRRPPRHPRPGVSSMEPPTPPTHITCKEPATAWKHLRLLGARAGLDLYEHLGLAPGSGHPKDSPTFLTVDDRLVFSPAGAVGEACVRQPDCGPAGEPHLLQRAVAAREEPNPPAVGREEGFGRVRLFGPGDRPRRQLVEGAQIELTIRDIHDVGSGGRDRNPSSSEVGPGLRRRQDDRCAGHWCRRCRSGPPDGPRGQCCHRHRAEHHGGEGRRALPQPRTGRSARPAVGAPANSNAPSSTRRRSPMSRTRCLGSFARHRRRNDARSAGTSPGSASHTGSRCSTSAKVSGTSSPSKGRRPVSISYSTQPNAQMSARLSTAGPAPARDSCRRRCRE